MPDFQGKFQYLEKNGSPSQQGACRLSFDAQTLTLTPDTGAAIVCDLGDLDAVTAADWEIRLPLYTGRKIVLSQFGRSYETLAHDLTDAYRNRCVQCMLLEDMGEIARFTGNFEISGSHNALGQAEIRLYKSNLAVLPNASSCFQWRLADIDDSRLDSSTYEIALQAGTERLRFSRLAKRTEEFATTLREAMNAIATQTAQALHSMFPFLNPDQLQACAALLREGRSAPVEKLSAIQKLIPGTLAKNAVDQDLKPYYDKLSALSREDLSYAGFKLIRSEGDGATPTSSEASDKSDEESEAPDADSPAPETLYWFFFPLVQPGTSVPANVVAWEASSRSGRATYFFRLVDPGQAGMLADPKQAAQAINAAIRRLNRVLAMLNFRRRPIYLSDDELASNPQFHRYAIAARRLPEVREVRTSFLGRALHSSPEAWQAQVEQILKPANGR